ncbi:LppA family lipoprotein [Saccharopolyspora sp. NPDC000359]|uniref:LppA family lipoprotein n=1 Tax=Saccharopolyspora sp. NPDC000359 TaxID=3154251 RepID=UPI00331817CA
MVIRVVAAQRVVLILLLLVLASGCGGNELTSEHGGSSQEQRAELLRRPSMEEASARYQEMLSRMRDELAKRFSWMRWETSQEAISAGCAEFDFAKDELESQTLGVWVAFGDIPEEEWPQVQQIVSEIASAHGFGRPRIMSDRPGEHTFTALDQYGAAYTVSGGRNISINGTTGCHLPQAVKDRIAVTGE